MSGRKYLKQSPWITFQFRADYQPLWTKLGEAFSKCQHLAYSPLSPPLASRLASIYLTKGALATTAIEGNTLTEEEAQDILDGGQALPESQDYLEQELRNIVAAIRNLDTSAQTAGSFSPTVEWIREQNRQVLEGLEHDDHVTPGEFTERQLTVGSYKAAPPEDAEYLLGELCDWLNKDWLEPSRNPDLPPELKFAYVFFAAVLGHLYVAWIHPFGDGNGRTARLLECAILANSGVVPIISSNVLSDYYNRTRSRYYRRLDSASKKDDVAGFVLYSANGFVDMLREQIDEIREFIRTIAWRDYVYDVTRDEPSGPAKDRRRELVLSMTEGELVQKRDVRTLTPGLALAYAQKAVKTISRDFGRLLELGLVREPERGSFVPNIEIMDAFRPALGGGHEVR